ncbi:MAG: hypothetical protein WBK91_04435 [Alphaproteobacteria bacterium]
MPFVQRDATNGKIVKAMTRSVPNAEFVQHGHPDLIAFLQERGVDTKQIDDALGELKRTDMDMSRAVEDLITALLKKSVIKISDLPKQVQDRIALRTRMRVLIAESYDRASTSRPLPSP